MKLKRTTKMGTYTVVIALIALAAIIFVNLIVSALPSKYTVFDTSAEKLYSISEESEKAVKNIKDDIVIYFMCPGGKTNGSEPLEKLLAFLNRYSDLNPKIKLRTIDPVESPGFASKYTDSEITDYSLIVESAKRFKIVDFLDIYAFDYNAYYTEGIESYNFNGDRLVTSALDYVTTSNLPKIYTLKGHGENALETALKENIFDLNYTLDELSLLTLEEVPEDASALIINAPSSDINEDEAKKIKNFLDKGGSLLLITSASRKELTNLISVAEYYGMTGDYGLIVEGDSNKSLSNTPMGLLPDIKEHSITSSLMSSTIILFPYAHPIKKTEDIRSGITYTPLFVTSDKAYTIEPDAEKTDKTDSSLTGPFTVGAVSESSDGGSVVWFASDYTFNDTMNSYSSGSNYKYFISAIQFLAPRDSIIKDIPSVSLAEPVLVVSEDQATFWSTVLTAIIPLAFVAIGVTKWVLRRRK